MMYVNQRYDSFWEQLPSKSSNILKICYKKFFIALFLIFIISEACSLLGVIIFWKKKNGCDVKEINQEAVDVQVVLLIMRDCEYPND